ncbi:hypothetical protein ACR6C2_38110 [Streptomyces sp. INA 01156]
MSVADRLFVPQRCAYPRSPPVHRPPPSRPSSPTSWPPYGLLCCPGTRRHCQGPARPC